MLASLYKHAPDGYVVGDDDREPGTSDDQLVRKYGRAAPPADRLAIAALARRYLVAALGEDAAEGCRLLAASVVSEARRASEVPHEYASPGAMPGSSCAAYAARLFKLNHQQLGLADVSSLKVAIVRVNHDATLGLAVLAFKTTPERQLTVLREAGHWKMASLLDEDIP